MSRQPRSQTATTPATTTRQNEYFVPRDGIDREVISADICRYLGNDALVRPGHYENPQTGQVVQGYYITAYRNLTTAMIEDLKADSARWDTERRAQTSRNTPGVQYRYSETHQSRQHHGPTEPPYQTESYPRESYEGPRYPGTGAPGYTGASGYQPPAQSGYSTSTGGTFSSTYQQSQQLPPADPRYPSGQAPMMRPSYQPSQDTPYIGTGANLSQSGYPNSNDPYASRMGSSTAAPPQPMYSNAPPPPSGYANPTPSYQYQSSAPPSASSHTYAAMQPHDPFYGRASPAGPGSQPQQQQQQAAFSSHGQQYDEARQSRASTAIARNQTPPTGSSARRIDRDSDRQQHRPLRR